MRTRLILLLAVAVLAGLTPITQAAELGSERRQAQRREEHLGPSVRAEVGEDQTDPRHTHLDSTRL